VAVTDRRARPRAGLTREKVLDAAIVYVDEHGLAALSTRKLGAALGVEGMTLYHYLPTKAALLDGMVERVLDRAAGDLTADLSAGLTRAGGPPWPATVRAVATRFRDVLLAHPGLLGVVATRPVNSPGAFRILEAGLAVMTGQGVPLARAMDTLNSVMTFVVGHTLAEAGQTPGHEDTQNTRDAEDAEPPAPDPAEYPNFAEAVRTGAGLDFTSRFQRTLDILIDGWAVAPDADTDADAETDAAPNPA
jgi:TetR/AcrR family tetracycline transcriptional repressor